MNLTHSCKRVAKLLSQCLDELLGQVDRWRLRAHLSMCSNCRNIAKQFAIMNTLSTEPLSTQRMLDDDGAEQALRSASQQPPTQH